MTEKYNHKGINIYEFMFILLSKCKKKDKKDEGKDNKTTDKKNEINRKYIFGNYDSYFSETYLIEIKYNLILSFKFLLIRSNLIDLLDFKFLNFGISFFSTFLTCGLLFISYLIDFVGLIDLNEVFGSSFIVGFFLISYFKDKVGLIDLNEISSFFFC